MWIRIRPSGLLRSRIWLLKIRNLFLDIWLDSLDGGSAHRKATAYTGQHNIEKRGHKSIPQAGFEPTIPLFELLKTICSLNRAAFVTGRKGEISWEDGGPPPGLLRSDSQARQFILKQEGVCIFVIFVTCFCQNTSIWTRDDPCLLQTTVMFTLTSRECHQTSYYKWSFMHCILVR
jgi:hypothetical protein